MKTARLITGGLVSLGLIGLPLAPATAHSELRSSDPAAGAVVQRLPAQVGLEFNQVIAARFASVTAAVGGGPARSLSVRVDGTRVVATLIDGSPASRFGVVIGYRVVSADGHPITGTISFTVAGTPSASPSEPSASARPSAPGPDEPTVAGSPAVQTPDPANARRKLSAGTAALVIVPLVVCLLAAGAAVVVRRRR